MTKGKEYYEEDIIDKSPVDVFTATNTAMLEYPFVLGRPNECSPTLASQARKYIMDSGIGDDSYTPSDVLQRADDIGATHVVAPDVLHNTRETTDGVVRMVELVEEYDMELIIPTQTDSRLSRANHYTEMSNELDGMGFEISDYIVAVGGIRDMSIEGQILEVKRFREFVGNDITLHAFGCGIHHDWVVAIRKWPEMIDSFDSSSVRGYVNNGNVFDCRMEVKEHNLPRGRSSTCLNTRLREQLLYMYNHIIGPYIREEDRLTEFWSDRLSEEF